MKVSVLMAMALLYCLTVPCSAVIYKWVDDRGQIQFTNDPTTIPEEFRKQALDFDKIEHEGGFSYDPSPKPPFPPKSQKEPFWKRFLRDEEIRTQVKRAKAAQEPQVTLYMANW